jgi:hypothetical protein
MHLLVLLCLCLTIGCGAVAVNSSSMAAPRKSLFLIAFLSFLLIPVLLNEAKEFELLRVRQTPSQQRIFEGKADSTLKFSLPVLDPAGQLEQNGLQ